MIPKKNSKKKKKTIKLENYVNLDKSSYLNQVEIFTVDTEF